MICNYCGKDVPQNRKQCPHCRAQVLDFEENATSNSTNAFESFNETRPTEKPSNGMSLGIIALFFLFFSPIVTIILANFGLSEAKKSQDIAKDAKISQTINTIAIIIATISILGTIIKTIAFIAYGINGEFL